MKLMNMTLTAMIIFGLTLTNVQASNRQVGGLILGGGTGAIVGQAVGHNSESIIVGAAVGGVVGLILGSELDKHHSSVNKQSTVVVYNSTHNHRRGPAVKSHNRHYPRFHHGKQNYRKTVVIEKGHHKTKRTVSTFRGNGYRDHYYRGTPNRQKGHHKTKRTVSTFRSYGSRDHYQRNRSDRHNVRSHH